MDISIPHLLQISIVSRPFSVGCHDEKERPILAAIEGKT